MTVAQTCKVIGTVSLGLMAGVNMTSLYTNNRDKRSVFWNLGLPFTITGISTLLGSFLLSSRSAKHPYLLYSSFMAASTLLLKPSDNDDEIDNVTVNATIASVDNSSSGNKKTKEEENLEQSYDHIDMTASISTDGSNVTTPQSSSVEELSVNGNNASKSKLKSCATSSCQQVSCPMARFIGISGSLFAFSFSLVGLYGDWL